MTQLQLDEILKLQPEELVKALSISTFTIPKWADLEVQYNPDKHAIKTNLTKYPPILNYINVDDMKRITRSLQKLAVDRMAQAIFVTPVERSYSYDRDSINQKKAVDIIEEIYRTQNYIDAENIERCKQLNASCQVATIWFSNEKPNIIEGEQSKYELSHVSYSEMDGYKIYANTDNKKRLIVISFSYKDAANNEYFDVYVNGKSPQLINLSKSDEGWKSVQSIKLEVFPVVYTHINIPVWGGDSGTTLVENIEELVSYQGMYVKKNAVPLFGMDMGDTTGMTSSESEETDGDKRRIVKLGKGGKIDAITWDGNRNAVQDQEKRLIDAFYADNQIPDTSFANMIASNTSADNKEIVFSDSKAKAVDLGGEWQKLFNDELNNIIIPNLKIMYPALAKDLDVISVRSKVKPYSVRSDKENAEYVATAGSSMSLETQIRKLNLVDDVDQEILSIQEENGAKANQL